MTPIPARPAPRRLLPIAALILAMLLQPAALAGIYKWTDESGEIQYTQTPPPQGVEAEKIEGAPPPTDSPQTINREQQRLEEQLKANEEERARKEEATAITELRKEDAEINQKNCITAQNNLAKLQQGGIKRYLTPEGEVIRLTEEERQRRITEANNQIKQYCTP